MDEKRAAKVFEDMGHRRRFLDTPIKLKSGNIVVSNQWRLADIERFIKKAADAGFKITPAKGEAPKRAAAKTEATKPSAADTKKSALEIQKAIDELGKKTKAPAKKSEPKKKATAKKKAVKK